MSTTISPYIFPTITKVITGNYNALDESMLLCDPTAASFTVTMPAMAAALNRRYYIKRTDVSNNTVTIALTDGTIDGDATFVMNAKEGAITLVTDGVGWFIF